VNNKLIKAEKNIPDQQNQEQQPQEQQVNLGQLAELEVIINDLHRKADDLKVKIKKEEKKKQQLKAKVEKEKRKQLAEAKLKNKGQLSTVYFTPEVKQKIENTQYEMRQKAEEEVSLFKSIMVWVILFGVSYFVIRLWRNLDETEKRFKDH